MTKSRIESTFENADSPCLITFTMAQDPDFDTALDALQAMAQGGADILEIGMPFTDPVADGETIQAAGQRALCAGGSMAQTLKLVQAFRYQNDTAPIVLMGYANPVQAYGFQQFAQDAKAAGVDGLIIVDIPPEESGELYAATSAVGLDLIRLITPTTDAARLKIILNDASGFLYYVSVTGVTGGVQADPARVQAHINEIRAQTDLPIAIGFGIRTPDDAAQFKSFAGGVVVGSALVNYINKNHKEYGFQAALSSKVQALKSALNTG